MIRKEKTEKSRRYDGLWLFYCTNPESCILSELRRNIVFNNAALRIGGWRLLFGMEHKDQKKDQKNAKNSKNNSIDDFFHMKDNNFCF